MSDRMLAPGCTAAQLARLVSWCAAAVLAAAAASAAGLAGCASPPSGASLAGSTATGQPTQLRIGERYPIEVPTHCGIRYLSFAGRYWETEHPIGDPGTSPTRGDVASYDGSVRGYGTVLDPNTVSFSADGLPVVIFHAISTEPPPCQ